MSKQNSLSRLIEIATDFDVVLTPAQRDQFQQYYTELVAWNQRVNLTAITDYADVQVKHFADSLAVLLAIDEAELGSQPALIDVGTGAGFPGLPLKIVRPAWRVTLVDSTRKKTDFLEHVVHELGLDGVQVVWARAEELGQAPAYRGRFDVAVARAVADLAVLAEYALPLLRLGGRFVAQKGTAPEEELATAKEALETLGGAHRDTLLYRLPGFDEPLHLVVIEKVAETPEKYPRRPGMPEKRPLG